MTISEGKTRVIKNVSNVGGLGDFFLEISERKLTHAGKPFNKCFWKYIYENF